MRILIKGLKMPEKGEYDATLRVYADGTATIDFVSTVLGDYAFYVTDVSAPHGRWEKKGVSIKGIEKEFCSDCKTWSYGRSKAFCPNCGAKMDEVKND